VCTDVAVRSATAAATVTILPGDPPRLSLPDRVVVVNAGSPRVALRASVDDRGNAGVTVVWTSSDLSDAQLAAVALTTPFGPVLVSYSTPANNGRLSHTHAFQAAIVVRPACPLPRRGAQVLRPTLRPGRYAFTVTATASSELQGVLQTSASLTLVVNGPPRNGYVGATPGEGVALSTAFTLIAPGWVDDDTVGCSMHPLGAV
jgi:hypothetical protein